jgi:hypothetical protein
MAPAEVSASSSAIFDGIRAATPKRVAGWARRMKTNFRRDGASSWRDTA